MCFICFLGFLNLPFPFFHWFSKFFYLFHVQVQPFFALYLTLFSFLSLILSTNWDWHCFKHDTRGVSWRPWRPFCYAHAGDYGLNLLSHHRHWHHFRCQWKISVRLISLTSKLGCDWWKDETVQTLTKLALRVKPSAQNFSGNRQQSKRTSGVMLRDLFF